MTTALFVTLVVGFAVLLFGRELFWLFVGAAGFFAGMTLAQQQLPGQKGWVILLIGIAAGVIGAVLAVVLQRFAAALAGLVAGGLIGLTLAERMAAPAGPVTWIIVLASGLLGFIVVFAVYDWALIVLSSLLGAAYIDRALHLRPPIELLVFAGLFVLGIVVQGFRLRRRPVVRRPFYEHV